jgi:hypothetical protein
MLCASSYSTSRLLVVGSTICTTSLSHSGAKSWPSSISTAWYWPLGIWRRSTPVITRCTMSAIFWPTGPAAAAPGRSHQLLAAPFVEVPHMHAPPRPLASITLASFTASGSL